MLVVLEFLLHSNYFSFDKHFYLQKQGVPMGAKFSPSLVNLYMAHWEEVYLFSQLNPFSSQISRYCRYIDDLLLIWEGPASLIQSFVDFSNDNPYNLTFTHNISHTSIQYLDVTLTSNINTGITVSPFRKSMARNTTLLATSCHPKHVIHNIPLGELICTKRNCTQEATYIQAEQEALERLHICKYPKWTLTCAQNKITHIKRDNLLLNKTSIQNITDPPITFSTTYSTQYHQITRIIFLVTNSLKIRIRRHLSDANRPLATGISMVSKHCIQQHGGSTGSIIFTGIQRISRPLRGGDLHKKRLNRESFWIYHLNTGSPNGLNIRQLAYCCDWSIETHVI